MIEVSHDQAELLATRQFRERDQEGYRVGAPRAGHKNSGTRLHPAARGQGISHLSIKSYGAGLPGVFGGLDDRSPCPNGLIKEWRSMDSNPGHADYDSAALTN